ncbi:IS630 family transposase [Prescottella equi]
MYTATDRARVTAWACSLPVDHDVPLSRWSTTELARQLLTDGVAVSVSTVRRWLADDALKPWQHQSWIFVRDPDFETEAARVLDLYARSWQGRALGADEYVISADEKPSIQARDRCHPTAPSGPRRSMRVNHDYRRGGALTYLAAYDVHRATVFGRCEQSTGIDPFTRLVDQVMSVEPYASAARVFWIVDNGSSHRGQAAIDRLAQRYPNAVMVHTPKHASWLNQVEIYFPSCSGRCSRPMISPIWRRSSSVLPCSRSAIAPLLHRSTGATPQPTCVDNCHVSTTTRAP